MPFDPCFSIQEKYKRDQEKLQEEWLKAQQDIAKSVDQQKVTKVLVDCNGTNLSSS